MSHLLRWAGLASVAAISAHYWPSLSSILPTWLTELLPSDDAIMADSSAAVPDQVRRDGPLQRLRSRAEVNASGDTSRPLQPPLCLIMSNR